MLRQAARELTRRGKDHWIVLQKQIDTDSSLGVRDICTGSICLAKKHNKTKLAQAGEEAANVLNKPALVEGFSKVPREPRFLGLAGALPFLSLAPPIAAGIPLMPADFVSSAATLQIGYGATIASFLGGIHWALAMASYSARGVASSSQDNTDRYVWSVMPCLLAWPAVTMQPGPGSFVVAVAISAAYVVDRSFAKRGLLPSWYMALRLPLTVAAVGGLTITCASSFTSHVPQRGALAEQKQD